MNKKFVLSLIFIQMFFVIRYPTIATNVVKDTLCLWYSMVVPALLPTLIIVKMLLSSNFSFKKKEVFCLFAGICCGFPIGAVIATSYIKTGQLSKEIGLLYASLFNQFSLSFLITYIGYNMLNIKAYEILIIIYIPQLMLLIAGKICYRSRNLTYFTASEHKNETFTTDVNYKVVDASIISSCEALIKIFGYMVICNLTSKLFYEITGSHILYILLAPIMEVTGGINTFVSSANNPLFTGIYAITTVTFGGLSGVFQVNSLLKNVEIPIYKYILLKCISSFITGIFAYIYFTNISP